MALNSAIIESDIHLITQLLSVEDPNTTAYGATPLYCALTGTNKKTDMPIKKGNVEIVEILLENNADPNKKFVLIPPVYTATFEDNYEMIIRLLQYGANPNVHATLKMITDSDYTRQMLCKLPIVIAIESGSFDCVNVLVKYGAFFNKCLIETTKNELSEAKEKQFRNNYWDERYTNLKKIIKLLESRYNNEIEDTATTYMHNFKQINGISNFFDGLQVKRS